MKKTNILKGLATVAVVAFASIFITGCIPTPTGGGNPSPTNLFNVNLSLLGKYPILGSYEASNSVSKTIVLDGDSINFYISKYYANTIETYAYFYASFKCHENNYELLQYNPVSFASFSNNTTVSNSSMPLNTQWYTLMVNDGTGAEGFITQLGYSSGGMSFNFININGLPLNEYRYWVFRKPKNGSYMYFWVKVIGVPDFLPTPNNVTIKVVDGRYQMNTITTGQ